MKRTLHIDNCVDFVRWHLDRKGLVLEEEQEPRLRAVLVGLDITYWTVLDVARALKSLAPQYVSTPRKEPHAQA